MATLPGKLKNAAAREDWTECSQLTHFFPSRTLRKGENFSHQTDIKY